MLLIPLKTNTPSSSIANSEAMPPSLAVGSHLPLYLPSMLFIFFVKILSEYFTNPPEILNFCAIHIIVTNCSDRRKPSR